MARGSAEVAKGALDRAQGLVRAIEAERDGLLAIERRETEAGAASLMSRIKAGLMDGDTAAKPDVLQARLKRADVEHRLDAARMALAGLDREHVTAVDASTRAETDSAAAVAALLKLHGSEMADRLVADAARLKFQILDFQTSGLPVFDHPHLFTIGDLGGMLGALRADRPDGMPAVDWAGYRARLLEDPDAPIPA